MEKDEKIVQVDMHEAKSRLPELAERVRRGERVVIAKAGKPPLDPTPHRIDQVVRTPGFFDGQIRMSDDVDDTSDELIRGFKGEGRFVGAASG